MANEQNLIPFDSSQNREEAKKNGKKGGVASGESRKRKKTMGALINQYFSFQINNEQAKANLKALGYTEEECNNKLAFMMQMMSNSKKGNARITELILEHSKDDEIKELQKQKLKVEIERQKLENERLRLENERLKNVIEGKNDVEDLTPLADLLRVDDEEFDNGN